MKNFSTEKDLHLEDQIIQLEKNTFKGGYKKVVLPANFELWRFCSTKKRERFGAYWILPTTMKEIMLLTRNNDNYSMKFKKDNVRNNLAIRYSWSDLGRRVKIRLKKDVIAYVGKIKTQKIFSNCKNDLIGNGDIEKLTEFRLGTKNQYVIPRFRFIKNNNEYASIEHEAPI